MREINERLEEVIKVWKFRKEDSKYFFDVLGEPIRIMEIDLDKFVRVQMIYITLLRNFYINKGLSPLVSRTRDVLRNLRKRKESDVIMYQVPQGLADKIIDTFNSRISRFTTYYK